MRKKLWFLTVPALFLILFLCTPSPSLFPNPYPLTPNPPSSLSFTPKIPFEGETVTFEIRGLRAPKLTWDFGDGTVNTSGPKVFHIYRRPGLFTVKVFSSLAPGKVVETVKVKIQRDNRRLVLSATDVLIGMPVTIEARNFADKNIKWDFSAGGGARWGGAVMQHTFTRPGNYKITAIDRNGKDSRKFTRDIRVNEDRRILVLPETVTAGETVEATIKNAAAGDFEWTFSNGVKQRGKTLKSLVLKQTGTISVTVKDTSGKLPPLTGQVKVLPDTRTLRSSFDFAFPDEAVTFDAVNFLAARVKWNFDDGSITSGPAQGMTHTFKKAGKYRVTAVDLDGKSIKTFSRQVQVGELSPGFRLTRLELAFADGKHYRVAKKHNIPPGYYVKLQARGRGILRGKWMLDGQVMGLFDTIVETNRTSRLEGSATVPLPVIDVGMHRFTIAFSNYNVTEKIPVLRYFVAESGEIELIAPEPGKKLPPGETVQLIWRLKVWQRLQAKPEDTTGNAYEIAVSEIPFQFLADEKVLWRPVGAETKITLETASYKDWVYWQVRQLNRSGQVLTTSDFGSFFIAKPKGKTRDKR